MNLEKFREVLDHILDDPDTWDQQTWCGTPCCLAGHAAWRQNHKRMLWLAENVSALVKREVPDMALKYFEIDAPDYWAGRLWLFDCERTFEDFERVARGEINEHGQPL